MKTQIEISKIDLLFAFFLAFISILVGCGFPGKSDLEGVYVNDAGSEYSLASDTLVVEAGEGNIFLIHRKTGFNLLDHSGKAGKLQHETEEWTAVWDEKAGILTEQRSGKLIRFSGDANKMLVGKREYKRIN